MNKEEGEALISTIRGFITDGSVAGKPRAADKAPAKAAPLAAVNEQDVEGAGRTILGAEQLEKIYLQFKARLLDELPHDPVALQLLMTRPEIVLEIEPRIVTLDGSQLKGRVARLLAGGWFTESRATSAVRRELSRTGADPGGGGTLSDKLAELKREGFLVDAPGGWLAAPNVKITEKTIEAAR